VVDSKKKARKKNESANYLTLNYCCLIYYFETWKAICYNITKKKILAAAQVREDCCYCLSHEVCLQNW